MTVAAWRYPFGAVSSGRTVRRLVTRPRATSRNSIPMSPGR